MGKGVRPMVKVKDIAEKYGEFEINEEELKKILVQPKPKTVWDLEVGDRYHFISPNGYITGNKWADEPYDNYRRDMGNCFLTQEEAEFELERRKVEAELLRCGGTRDMMSIGDNDIRKYYILYSHLQDKVGIGFLCSTCHLGCIYFKSEEDARRAIDSIGEDRIKKYLFYIN